MMSQTLAIYLHVPAIISQHWCNHDILDAQCVNCILMIYFKTEAIGEVKFVLQHWGIPHHTQYGTILIVQLVWSVPLVNWNITLKLPKDQCQNFHLPVYHWYHHLHGYNMVKRFDNCLYQVFQSKQKIPTNKGLWSLLSANSVFMAMVIVTVQWMSVRMLDGTSCMDLQASLVTSNCKRYFRGMIMRECCPMHMIIDWLLNHLGVNSWWYGRIVHVLTIWMW